MKILICFCLALMGLNSFAADIYIVATTKGNTAELYSGNMTVEMVQVRENELAIYGIALVEGSEIGSKKQMNASCSIPQAKLNEYGYDKLQLAQILLNNDLAVSGYCFGTKDQDAHEIPNGVGVRADSGFHFDLTRTKKK